MGIIEQEPRLEFAATERPAPGSNIADGFGHPAAPPNSSTNASANVQPTRIGRYVILGKLGEGGMGVVYAAYDTDLDRKVAIKIVHSDGTEQSQGRARVVREAQAMAQLSHPNVVHVYEVGEHVPEGADPANRQVHIVMEFIAGTNLQHWQRQPGRSIAAILSMYVQAGEGLLAAHRSSLIHRDFKPDNVLVDKEGRAHVADFGLARKLRDSNQPPTQVNSEELLRPLNERLTEAGAIMGTPRYMSPEQFRCAEVDARSDEWSFCAALYEALYKQPPFAGETLMDLGQNVISGDVRPPPPSDVPEEVTRAILKGLSVNPADRFSSMSEILSELRKGIDPHIDTESSKRGRRIFAWGVAIISVAGSFPAFLANEPPRIQQMIQAGVGALAISLFITVAAYRRLAQHPVHWRMTLLIALCLIQLVLGRIAALTSNLTIDQYAAIDHVILIGTLAVASYRFMPKLIIGVVLTFVSGLLNLLAPQVFWRAPVILYPVLTILIALWWPKRVQGDARPHQF